MLTVATDHFIRKYAYDMRMIDSLIQAVLPMFRLKENKAVSKRSGNNLRPAEIL